MLIQNTLECRGLRVANASYFATRPYRVLKDIIGIDYSERSVMENARLLREGLVDLALIPTSEYAIHGGYVGLDFGLACTDKSESVYLCSKVKPNRLSAIFVLEESGTAAILLRFLTNQKWHSAPEILRVPKLPSYDELQQDQAVLTLEGIETQLDRYANKIDIAEEWYKLSGKPCVFLIWACLPAKLYSKKQRIIRDVMYRSATAVQPLVEEAANDALSKQLNLMKYWSANYHYYLNNEVLDGLDEFYVRAAEAHILPSSSYLSAGWPIVAKNKPRSLRKQTVDQIFDLLVKGQRLGIDHAKQLYEKASFADLAMLVDDRRLRFTNNCQVIKKLHLDLSDLKNENLLIKEIQLADKSGFHRVILLPTTLLRLSDYQNILLCIKQHSQLAIEAFTIPQLYQLSETEDCSLNEILAKLATAGLNYVSALGSGMLSHNGLIMHNSQYNISKWLSAFRQISRIGLKTFAYMHIDKRDTWDERFSHLQTLRSIQDEQQVFSSFEIRPMSFARVDSKQVEDYLRAIVVTRLFLDNIASFQESDALETSLSSLLAVSLGADKVAVQSTQPSSESAVRVSKILNSLGVLTEVQTKPNQKTGSEFEVH